MYHRVKNKHQHFCHTCFVVFNLNKIFQKVSESGNKNRVFIARTHTDVLSMFYTIQDKCSSNTPLYEMTAQAGRIRFIHAKCQSILKRCRIAGKPMREINGEASGHI